MRNVSHNFSHVCKNSAMLKFPTVATQYDVLSLYTDVQSISNV